MANVAVYNMEGKEVDKIELNDSIFGVEINEHLVHMAVLQQLANKRQGTQKAKTRSEVRGGGRKPWRQKGTGHARQGSTRSPQWTGGGVVFAPTPRDYSFKLNKKEKRAALKSALTSRVVENKFVVVDELKLDEIKTKKFVEVLKNLNVEKALVILNDMDEKVIASAANIPTVKTTQTNELNVFDVLKYDTVVVTKAAVATIEEVYADRWKDYEVIDCSCGEKLERWAKYILLRPDPQVIWDTPKTNKNWKKLNGHYHRSKKGGGEWEFFDLPQEWTINYSLPINKELTFHLKPFSFKHTGLFPEQAANWDWFSKKIYDAKKSGRDVKVLNLFAYTGGATLAAAAACAAVTHVDASKGMVTWAKENAVSSGLGDAPIRWLVDDCVKFVEREIRRGNHYDAIIMDPPSYGRGPKGEIWKIEESVYPLVQLCAKLLTDKPLFFLINSYTTGLQPAVLTYMISTALKKFDGKVTASEIGLPVSSNGLVLPCGASGRFEGSC